jgi:ribosome-associated translation inhibitor RaiA
MQVILAAEHFRLTPAIRSTVEELTDRFTGLLPEEASIKVFLVANHHKIYSALYRVRWAGREVVCRKTERNMYTAIRSGAHHLRQTICDLHRKRVNKRKGEPWATRN